MDEHPTALADTASKSDESFSRPDWRPGSRGWHSIDPRDRQREELTRRTRGTDAAAQLQRCFPRWLAAFDGLPWSTLVRLADNKPVDPNDPDTWDGPTQQAQAVLRRHGLTDLKARALTTAAGRTLCEGQVRADCDAGLDWSTVTAPASALDERLRRAHATLPIDLADASIYLLPGDQRHALARRLDLPVTQADDLSRYALAKGSEFIATDLRCWRIGSDTWLALADEELEPVGRVERPVGLFLAPAFLGGGWALSPTLSLDAIRLIHELGGRLDRSLTEAIVPMSAAPALIERVSLQTLHAGPKECLDSAGQLATELSRELRIQVSPGAPREKRDRWGRLLVRRNSYSRNRQAAYSELHLRVVTFAGREFPTRRVGAQRLQDAGRRGEPSATMDLGEAVATAVERELPLLLSTEASGHLKDRVRIGRMKGRPGLLSVTTSDGISASTRRVSAEQAPAELRKLKAANLSATLDAGARQLVRMAIARPLRDDPILLGRQQEVSALKVVGSGVDASQVGTGKTVNSGRAVAQRAAVTPRMRALIIAEGRLLGQWRDELALGAPGRGLPPLAPNVEVLMLDDRKQVAGQIRAFDRELGDRGGAVLASNSILDRYPADLQAIDWHLLIADEALRYVNPATEAHQALAQVRFGSVADCWLLTATPRGKNREALDVLVGLAVGDRAMITERMNTREAGDLMDEINAHRLRVNYGPHLVRVTRQDMQAWMPDVLPAKPIAVDPDPALAALLEAIRKGGQEAYRRLLAVLRELKTLESGTPLFKAALAEMSRAQGLVLGNVGTYVMASVDPKALEHSQATLAAALVRQGVVKEACLGGGDGLPLLRGVVAQTLAGIVGEEQVLVFGERVWCLRYLAQTLQECHGVEAHVADGSTTPGEFEELKARFTAGEFPVLCLSPIGQQGHNLQIASTIVHLDLPWVPGGLEQRVGRAARPGSKRDYLQTYIPYVRGGGIEHVVSVLSPRGGEHHQVLDSFEGVTANESTIATQLGAISGQVATSKHEAGFEATAARLRVAAAVFGS